MGVKKEGYKVTPARVVELLQKAVSEKSQYAVAKETGLALSVIQGLLKGDREPSTGTLSKLGSYFNASVSWLRGENEDRFRHLVSLPSEREMKKWNTQDMAKMFKKLSLQEQENVAQMTSYFVALSPEQQRDLIASLMEHYFKVHGTPSNTDPMYDADGRPE